MGQRGLGVGKCQPREGSRPGHPDAEVQIAQVVHQLRENRQDFRRGIDRVVGGNGIAVHIPNAFQRMGKRIEGRADGQHPRHSHHQLGVDQRIGRIEGPA